MSLLNLIIFIKYNNDVLAFRGAAISIRRETEHIFT